MLRRFNFILCVVFFSSLAGCEKSANSVSSKEITAPTTVAPAVHNKNVAWINYPKQPTTLSPQAQLGKQLFFDKALSASGNMSCASCHQPDHAYAPANDFAVQLGGKKMDQAGTRSVPSLRYLTYTPLFTRHFYIPTSEGLEDEGPTGGFTHDGAVATLHEQASIPLLSPLEMANVNAASVAQKVQASSYAQQFQHVFGAQIFDDPLKTLEQVGRALEAFQVEDNSFHPYTSKFDAVISGNATFSDAELRGYRLFKDPAKGNCAKCHVDNIGAGGKPAQFTDFEFEAIGVPRNPAIAANNIASYFDLGLCGPYRHDLNKEGNFCGMFKTPTLRNVATRQVFFHNGFFHRLDDVMHFYVERDSQPQKWYPHHNGKVQIYDDLPQQYRRNVDHVNAPFDRKKGTPVALNDAEIKDLIEFLNTLNDGYSNTAGGN